MKLDEDLGPDRQDEFQTDDEENQAERNCDYDDDDDVSQSDDLSPGSRNSSDNYVDVNTPSWPQSYRFLLPFSPISMACCRSHSSICLGLLNFESFRGFLSL